MAAGIAGAASNAVRAMSNAVVGERSPKPKRTPPRALSASAVASPKSVKSAPSPSAVSRTSSRSSIRKNSSKGSVQLKPLTPSGSSATPQTPTSTASQSSLQASPSEGEKRDVALYRVVYADARARHTARPEYQERMKADGSRKKFNARVILKEVFEDVKASTRKCIIGKRTLHHVGADDLLVRRAQREEAKRKWKRALPKLRAAVKFITLLKKLRENSEKSEVLWKDLSEWSTLSVAASKWQLRAPKRNSNNKGTDSDELKGSWRLGRQQLGGNIASALRLMNRARSALPGNRAKKYEELS